MLRVPRARSITTTAAHYPGLPSQTRIGILYGFAGLLSEMT
jgi:hypothetical protein